MGSTEKKKLREILDRALCHAFLSALRLWEHLHRQSAQQGNRIHSSPWLLAPSSTEVLGSNPHRAHQQPCLLRSPSGQYQGSCTILPRPSHVPQHSYCSSTTVHSMGSFGQDCVDLPSTSPCVKPWFLLFLSGLGKVGVPSAKVFPPFVESTAGSPYPSCTLHTQRGWRGRSSWPVIPFVGVKVWAPWLPAPSQISGAQGHLSCCPGWRRACPQWDSAGTGLEQGVLLLLKRGLFNTCLHSMCKYYEESEKKSPESHFTQMLPWIDYCPFMADGETL